MGFLIYKKEREGGRVTENLLATHWNTVHSMKFHIASGIRKLRNMKELPVRSYTPKAKEK